MYTSFLLKIEWKYGIRHQNWLICLIGHLGRFSLLTKRWERSFRPEVISKMLFTFGFRSKWMCANIYRKASNHNARRLNEWNHSMQSLLYIVMNKRMLHRNTFVWLYLCSVLISEYQVDAYTLDVAVFYV